MRHETTSPTLLEAVADIRDDAAWRRFESLYRPLILRCCRGLGLRLTEAEDASQEVLIGLARVMPTFSYDPARGRFRSYVGQAVRHAVLRQWRRRGPQPGRLGVEPIVDPTAIDAAWEDAWRRHHCRLAIESVRSTLAPNEADILNRMLIGEPADCTAAAHAMTGVAVRKARQRLRERLRTAIERQIEREERGVGT